MCVCVRLFLFVSEDATFGMASQGGPLFLLRGLGFRHAELVPRWVEFPGQDPEDVRKLQEQLQRRVIQFKEGAGRFFLLRFL